MDIQPVGSNIQLEFAEAKAGILDTSSRQSVVEYAKVIAISPGAEMYAMEVGDYVFVKAWAVDIISHEDKKYYFCNVETNGILAIVRQS